MTKFYRGTQLLIMNATSWGRHPYLHQQIQGGRWRRSWISWNTNISAADKNICTKFGGLMRNRHLEMITWPKVETWS